MSVQRKQLHIENHVLLVCPHCWTEKQLAQEYPELKDYPRSRSVCSVHLQLLLTGALERAPFYVPAAAVSQQAAA